MDPLGRRPATGGPIRRGGASRAPGLGRVRQGGARFAPPCRTRPNGASLSGVGGRRHFRGGRGLPPPKMAVEGHGMPPQGWGGGAAVAPPTQTVGGLPGPGPRPRQSGARGDAIKPEGTAKARVRRTGRNGRNNPDGRWMPKRIGARITPREAGVRLHRYRASEARRPYPLENGDNAGTR